MTLLKTENLTVSIANKVICRDLQFDIQTGERWGILGPNGSGKTTLLQTLAKLHPITSGQILLQNKNLSQFSTKEIAQRIGILFQHKALSSLQTVFEFCLAGRHPHRAHAYWDSNEDKQLARDALMTLDLADKMHRRIHTLSGGEYQRLAIATLITQAPQLYLLDEPTNSLDMHHQIKLLNLFKQLSEKNRATTIMVLHDINIAQHYCDRILMIFHGGEILHGATETMLTRENLQRLYQHPLQSFKHEQGQRWFPEFNPCKTS
jgi:iron complex transport system ATP-binding protein